MLPTSRLKRKTARRQLSTKQNSTNTECNKAAAQREATPATAKSSFSCDYCAMKRISALDRPRRVAAVQTLSLLLSLGVIVKLSTEKTSRVTAAESFTQQQEALVPLYENNDDWAVLDDQDHQASSVELENYVDLRDRYESVNTRHEKLDAAEENEDKSNSLDVIVVATVDGTLAGLDKQTGAIVWKRSASPTLQQQEQTIFQPLLSTTTTVKSSSSSFDQWRTTAVPSIDGHVYLTATTLKSPRNQGATLQADHDDYHDQAQDTTASASEDVTVTTTVSDVVARAPFVDSRGRIYTGTRQSTAFALDGSTGDILNLVMPTSSCVVQETSAFPFQNCDKTAYDNVFGSTSSLNSNTVVWLGRVDFSVSIHESRSGQLDVQFSSSMIMSVQDMLLGSRHNQPWQQHAEEDDEESNGEIHAHELIVPPTQYQADASSFTRRRGDASHKTSATYDSLSSSVLPLVATPNGNVAFRDPTTGKIRWIIEEAFDTPVAFAVDAATGASLGVDVVPDAVMPGGSLEYLTMEMQRQIRLIDGSSTPWEGETTGLVDSTTGRRNEFQDRSDHDEAEHADDVSEDEEDEEQTVVGALSNGQLFAMPLARRHKPTSAHSSQHSPNHRKSRTAASSTAQNKYSHAKLPPHSSISPFTQFESTNKHQYHYKRKKSCLPGHAGFPSCLTTSAGDVLALTDGFRSHSLATVFGNIGGSRKVLKSATDLDGDENNAVALTSHYDDDDYILPDYFYTLKDKEDNSRRQYQKLFRILGSWLPPTIALIFVLSFELGRRKRQKDAVIADLDLSEVVQVDGKATSTTTVGVIQVFDDVILGYGGHGTVVYKGLMDGRQVAVKRMLKTYLASADREISLLIESDGHPNVVRYFLKEVRGDFVYLALELCDMSLHDLIGNLRNRQDFLGKDDFSISLNTALSTKSILYQIACGVRHLHSLRIVHRDLKPMNILLADSRKKSKRNESDTVCLVFDLGNYIAKISDMGLSKKFSGQSSFGASLLGEASIRGHSVAASIVGPGPGSVGWQAPEVMAIRAHTDAPTVRSYDGSQTFSDHLNDVSPMDNATNARTSRSVDIFSLGCIFYTTLVPAEHPFGAWFEREANIMHNRPDMTALEKISPIAYDLVNSMIQRKPSARPTAKQICDHPFFWSQERKLSFLCDFSDRLEMDPAPGTSTSASLENNGNSVLTLRSLAVERNAANVVGLAWDSLLDDDLINNVQRFRTYDPSSVRHLLRLIRNKNHHFDELSSQLKSVMGFKSEGLMDYFEGRFPRLIIHCFHVCRDMLLPDDPLSLKYTITQIGQTPFTQLGAKLPLLLESADVGTLLESSNEKVLEKAAVSTSNEEKSLEAGKTLAELVASTEQCEKIADQFITTTDVDETVPLSSTQTPNVEGSNPRVHMHESKEDHPQLVSDIENREPCSSVQCSESEESPSLIDDTPCIISSIKSDLQSQTLQDRAELASLADDLVIWEGSTAAKTFDCRGWSRSDEEWIRRLDASLRKRDSNLIRCADDPKFRTRLCNHWESTFGTACPMLKRKKCIFAHGPVELRVKDGKRNRWGKLVDKNGDNNNPNHSGGEDTYGAARSIETERKQEGKWNPNSTINKSVPKGKKAPSLKKKTHSSKEESNHATSSQ